ncbi:hypothetical protein [Reyranella sp.]|uniref:hypothetical protein n=1 Tax=Reyranella sp. TaxID=1929291 RepID=UPI00121275E9|nr:hypothetical protein [Reyranella sp.]TAJ91040.1 MAG: hypothetical protein EPO50_00490 [Reyranella sp.]
MVLVVAVLLLAFGLVPSYSMIFNVALSDWARARFLSIWPEFAIGSLKANIDEMPLVMSVLEFQ